nr:immunoglobulin light chain junction region [Macaca mulatta]MOV37067.1 immunoglobulin light chain junction region [Macaca mulatta]MOV37135.1 immunoglobulin light chain junction region [Macaca mulatta]MOV37197.1 immunoglobulin light chain junction region [Macaca mulatta]MOV37241.1 immunoglobulin light chain junction region [Macaca mulatta]
CMQGKQLPLTF